MTKISSIIGSIRTRAHKTSTRFDDGLDRERPLTKQLPRIEDRVADLEISQLMMNGIWMKKRIVITKALIAVARAKGEAKVSDEDMDIFQDAIPLCHIKGIRILQDGDDPQRTKGSVKYKGSLDKNMFSDLLKDCPPQPSSVQGKVDGSLTANVGGPGCENKSEVREQKCTEQTKFSSRKMANRRNSGLEANLRNAIEITTNVEGYNSGRIYYFRTDSDSESSELVDDLLRYSKIAREKHEAKTRMQKIQERVRKIYVSTATQCFVGLLIMTNFGCNIVESQMNQNLVNENGEPTSVAKTLDTMNFFFIIVFTIELGINMFSHWFHRFISDPWCLFDFAIVVSSLVALGPIPIPSSMLRLLRAFRVIRLFGRIKSVKQVIIALTEALLPVMNAFLIMFVALSIYAIVGVDFFADADPDDFSRFDQAFVALFRVLAGDSWAEHLDMYHPDGSMITGNIVYMLTFRLFVDWILLQVSVAVLLDKFVSATARLEFEETQALREEQKKRQRIHNPLDPFLERLTADYIDDPDLSQRILQCFKECDLDESNTINFQELCDEMKRMDFEPPIHLTPSDFAVLTQNGALCNDKGEVTFEMFELAIRQQLKQFSLRRMADVLKLGRSSEEDTSGLSALKAVVAAQSRVEKTVERLEETTGTLDKRLTVLQSTLDTLVCCVLSPRSETVGPPSTPDPQALIFSRRSGLSRVVGAPQADPVRADKLGSGSTAAVHTMGAGASARAVSRRTEGQRSARHGETNGRDSSGRDDGHGEPTRRPKSETVTALTPRTPRSQMHGHKNSDNGPVAAIFEGLSSLSRALADPFPRVSEWAATTALTNRSSHRMGVGEAAAAPVTDGLCGCNITSNSKVGADHTEDGSSISEANSYSIGSSRMRQSGRRTDQH